MVCLCGSSYCDCKEKCFCDRELCKCSSCQQLWKRIKPCGNGCQYLQGATSSSACKCEPFAEINFNKLPDLDFLSNKIESSGASGVSSASQARLSPSTPKIESDPDSETSFDRSITQADELHFQTDGTDSSPDKNLEIKRLAELSPSPHLSPSPIPTIIVSYHGESASTSECPPKVFSNSPISRIGLSQSSNMSLESPPLNFSVESYESPPASTRPISAPPVNTGSSTSRRSLSRIPNRALSTTPKSGLCSTAEDNAQMSYESSPESYCQASALRVNTGTNASCRSLSRISGQALPGTPKSGLCSTAENKARMSCESPSTSYSPVSAPPSVSSVSRHRSSRIPVRSMSATPKSGLCSVAGDKTPNPSQKLENAPNQSPFPRNILMSPSSSASHSSEAYRSVKKLATKNTRMKLEDPKKVISPYKKSSSLSPK